MSLMSPFEIIPSEWHLIATVVTALVGFLLLMKVSSIKPLPKDSEKSDLQSMPSTPITKGQNDAPSPFSSVSPVSKKLMTNFGSVATPGGRRSARIAQKSH